FFERVSKKIFVVEVNAGDDGDQRRKNVRGVEPSAQTHFEDSEFHTVAGEAFEGHRGQAFEISGMRAQLVRREKLLDQSLQPREHRGERLIAQFLAVDPYALVDSLEMRRGIQTRAKAGMPKNGFEESRRRPFAVRSRNMRARIGTIGAPKTLGQHGDVFEVELRRRSLCWRRQFPAQR